MNARELLRRLTSMVPPLVDPKYFVESADIDGQERLLLNWILDVAEGDCKALYAQALEVTLASRHFGAYGFVSELRVPPRMTRDSRGTFATSFLDLRLQGLEFAADVTLYVRDGVIHKLQGQCRGPEEWPRQALARVLPSEPGINDE
jgi:hypothetical protein